MTAFDILTLLLCGGAALLGLKRGFVTEALSMGAWVAAVAAVKLLHAPVAVMLAGPVGTGSGASMLAFALIYGATFLAVRFFARSFGNSVKSSFVGGFDRILGLGFGLLKGLILATILFTLVTLLHDMIYGGISKRPVWMTESRSYALLNATSGALVNFVDKRRKAGGEEAEKPTR
jgi:membrane protein required for colicin V production